MKSKLKALLGIGLTLVLLTSLTVGLAAPAAADPGTLKFSTLALPKVDADGDYWAYPGSDVGAIAIASDGETLFAAVEKTGWQVMKSTDGGYAWRPTGFNDALVEAGDDTAIVDVVVSPDYEEDLTVFAATKDLVYQSVDGGKNFFLMNAEWADTETITDLDVALDERGRLAIMVGTSTVVPVELQKDGDGSFSWSTVNPHSGSYSALLNSGTGGDTANAARVTVLYGDTLASITSLSFWMNIKSATLYPACNIYAERWADGIVKDGYHGAYITLELDRDGNGVEDDWLILADYGEESINTWVERSLAEGFHTSTALSGPPTGQSHWHSVMSNALATWPDPTVEPEPYNYGTLAQWQGTTLGTATVLKVKIAVGEWTAANVQAYVDDITVNGVTYYLEDDPDPLAEPEEGVAYTFAGDVYVLSTATGMSWQAQGIGDYDVLACAFSPFFADDEGIAAVVTSSVNTLTRVRFSFANTADGGGWGDDIADAPITDAKGNNYSSEHASIAFPDDFDPWGIGNNVCFVGTYMDGDTATANAGDVYKIVLKEAGTSSAIDLDIRGILTTLLPTETDIVSIDVCGPAEAATILVGTDICDLTSTLVSPPEQFLVYYSTDSGGNWAPAAKAPTGGDIVTDIQFTDALTQVLMSPDFCDSGIAYAATWGEGTSAFSRTKDSGKSWNQISLVDYGDVGYYVDDLDAAGYNAEGTLRMTTLFNDYFGAVWERTEGKNWERIFSYANPGVTQEITELIINGDETMFAVDYAAGKIWRSSDIGATWPKKITTKPDLSAVKVVSPTTLYTGHDDGGIYWSTRSGVGWTKPDDNENTAGVANIAVSGDFVLVGTFDGKVFISSDGGETVERVGLTNPGTAGPPTLATFGFATTDLIYATQVVFAGAGVWRCEVNYADPAASEWERIDDFQDEDPYDYTTVATGSPAIALPPSGVLYVIDGAPVDTPDVDGGLWRCTNPTDPDPYPYFEKENKGLDAGDSVGLLDLDVFPTVLFCSVSNIVLEEETVPYHDQVVMFTDTLDSGVTLADPADKAAGVGTLYEGQWEVDVVLAWAEMTGATKYQYQVAIDKEFASVLPDSGFTAGRVAALDLSPNTTYYWRVRVAYKDADNPIGAPLISPWSEKWSFKTVIGPTVARPSLEAPAAGEIDIALSPTFEWSGIEWADKYEFELGTDPATKAGGYFAAPLVSLTGANALVSTAWKCDIDLDYEGRYYWHVKAIGVDTETPWSDVGTFVTMAKPVVPPEPTAPVVIPPVEEITPAWIWAIIGIGAALVIAVVVLVVTTRRVP